MRRVVLLGFIWGWSFLFIKVAVRGMSPAMVVFARVALGMTVMLAVLRARRSTLPRDGRAWRHFTVMGLMYSALPFTLLAWSEQHITSALTAVLNASTSLFAAVAAAVGLGERLRRRQLLGLVLGFVGVAVAGGLAGRDLASSSLAGVVATLVASACYGFSFAYAQRHLVGIPPLVAACGQLVAATALIAPVAAVTTLVEGIHVGPRQAAAVALLGVFGTGIAYVLNYQAIAAVGSTRASLVTYLVPIVAVTVGVAFLDEPFHLRLVVGGGMTIAGIALVQDRLRRLRPLPATSAPVLVVLAALVLGSCGGGSDGTGPEPAAPGCGQDRQEPLDPRSTHHLLPGAPEPPYAGDPPTSGPHLAGASPTGVQQQPLPRPVQVGVLERGGVLVQHDGLDGDDRRRVEGLAGDLVVVAPHPGLPAPVVATAWRHRLECRGVDLAALRAFIAAHQGRGAGP